MNIRNQLIGLLSLLPLMEPAAAASLSPSSLTMIPGQVATVTVSNIRGSLSLQNSKPGIASAQLASARITVTALTVGSTTVTVKDTGGKKTLQVKVNPPPMAVSPESLSLVAGQSANVTVSNPNGTVQASSSNASVARATVNGTAVLVQGDLAII